MTERWADIKGYEGRYQISDQGRVKSLPFKQRYVLRTGEEAYRLTAERILKTQIGRHGYELVCLNFDNVRTGRSVHSLVAQAFVEGAGETVNHIDGVKHHNHASNLEWCSYTDNHLHAVALGLNKQAVRVRDPVSGNSYLSIHQAAIGSGLSDKYVRTHFERLPR